MDAYPATQNYITQEKLSPPGIVMVLSAKEIKPKSPLEMIAQNGGLALPKPSEGKQLYNPRGQFKRFGWDVYDDAGLKLRPEKAYQFKITPDRFSSGLNQEITDLFSQEELSAIRNLIANNDGDKLSSVFVTTDGYLHFTVKTPDMSIGKNGVYSIQKKLPQATADRIRSISPDFK